MILFYLFVFIYLLVYCMLKTLHPNSMNHSFFQKMITKKRIAMLPTWPWLQNTVNFENPVFFRLIAMSKYKNILSRVEININIIKPFEIVLFTSDLRRRSCLKSCKYVQCNRYGMKINITRKGEISRRFSGKRISIKKKTIAEMLSFAHN